MRPTKYKEEFCAKVGEYLEQYQDEWVDGKRLKVRLPTMESFAKFIGVNPSSIYLWREKYPNFSKSLEDLLAEQRQRLIEMGLSGDYNSTIAKLILSANHNMHEKKETDLTTGGQPFTVTAVDYSRLDDQTDHPSV